MTPASTSDRPALLGGEPIRPAGPPDWPPPDAGVAARLAELAQSGDWGRYHGPWCDQLADRIRAVIGSRHVHLCCSGTASVELALRGIGVHPGDEVLLAGYDFKANLTNVLHLGASPVLVDIRPDDWQLDVARLEAARSSCTRAVIASHLHGGLVDMAELRVWADAHGIAVIEDACQAPGAVAQGRPAGGWGDVGVWSFGGSKLLTAGRGGAVWTSRDDVAQRMRLYAHRGNDAYPLSEMQAAILLPQLDQLAGRNLRRAAAVARLDEQLRGSGLTRLASPRPLDEPAYYKVGWQYHAARFDGLPRDRFAAAMRAEGIALDPGFRALHRTHARSRFRSAGELPVAAAADDSILTLHHPVLCGESADLDQIVAAVLRVRRFARELGAE